MTKQGKVNIILWENIFHDKIVNYNTFIDPEAARMTFSSISTEYYSI